MLELRARSTSRVQRIRARRGPVRGILGPPARLGPVHVRVPRPSGGVEVIETCRACGGTGILGRFIDLSLGRMREIPCEKCNGRGTVDVFPWEISR